MLYFLKVSAAIDMSLRLHRQHSFILCLHDQEDEDSVHQRLPGGSGGQQLPVFGVPLLYLAGHHPDLVDTHQHRLPGERVHLVLL